MTLRKDALAVTRELKLALIVGFALVLLVTVLISDHLSKARKAELAGNVTDAPSGVITPANEPALGPVVTINQGTGGGIVTQPPVMVGPALNNPDAALVVKDPARDPLITSQLATRGGEPIPMPPMVNTGPANMTNGLPAATPMLPQAPTLGMLPGTGQGPDSVTMHESRPPAALLPGFDAGTQQAINTPAPLPVPSDTVATKPTETKPAADKADERWHTVASGDSAYSIAKKYYGKGEFWPKLKEANGNRIGDKGQLRVGVKVRIPEPASIGIKGVDAPKATKPSRPDATPKETRIADTTPAKPKGPREYTVQRGDTLGIISQKQLGTSKRVDDILKLNKGIRNPNALQVGARIMLPAA
jgi:nucleoid-associated protein YgaU